MEKIFSLALVLIFVGCSSTRINEEINYKAVGADAQKEIEKFSLSNFTAKRGSFESEGILTSFDMSKFDKILDEVSPSTKEAIPALDTKETISWGIYAFCLATIFIRDSEGQRIDWLYYTGALSFLGYSFAVVVAEQIRLRDNFNKDLKAKFAPKLSYTFNF